MQNSYSVNSDNLWFPVTAERVVYVEVPPPHNHTGTYLHVFVTGYR